MKEDLRIKTFFLLSFFFVIERDLTVASSVLHIKAMPHRAIVEYVADIAKREKQCHLLLYASAGETRDPRSAD